MSTETRPIPEADRIRAMKLFLLRRTAALFAKITDPQYSGYMTVQVHSKGGRPFNPQTGDIRQGIFEE
ncbi:MAG: hypothetical protein ACLP9L_04805 [Thermoguttaceae bacterium]